MKKYILTILALSLFVLNSSAQGFAWGIKGGPSMGLQKWDTSEREPLFTYNGILFIESLTEENDFTLFAQAGYNKRGSVQRIRSFSYQDVTGQNRNFNGNNTKYEFTNLSLSLGAKQKFDFGLNHKMYYLFGVRGEYTIDTNLDQFDTASNPVLAFVYPFESAVQKWNAGFIFGGGLEFSMTEFIGAIVELTVNPDFTKQYFHPDIPNVILPSNGGSSSTGILRERNIRNTTIELSVGFRFLRVVEYVD